MVTAVEVCLHRLSVSASSIIHTWHNLLLISDYPNHLIVYKNSAQTFFLHAPNVQLPTIVPRNRMTFVNQDVKALVWIVLTV